MIINSLQQIQLLEKLREANVVHGNLKPSKILVKESVEEGTSFVLCGFEKSEFLEYLSASGTYQCKLRLWRDAARQKFASVRAHKKMRIKFVANFAGLASNS